MSKFTILIVSKCRNARTRLTACCCQNAEGNERHAGNTSSGQEMGTFTWRSSWDIGHLLLEPHLEAEENPQCLYIRIYIYLYVEALLPKHKQCLQAWFGLSLAAEASRASCKEHRTIKLFACPLFRYRPAWLGFTAQQNWFGLAEKTLAKCCVPGSENQKQSGKNLKFTLLIWRRQRNLAGALG